MKKAKRMSHVWLCLSLFSAVSAIAGTLVLALVALRGLYVPMALLIPVVAHGYWGFGFYVRACYRARLYGRLAALSAELGTRDSDKLSVHVGLKPAAVAAALSRAEQKGYL
ncbi:MAG: hypothetical protein IJW48_04650 [Clostridia bacterium]|nr:hypothetical protein [Clostridia bacterium]